MTIQRQRLAAMLAAAAIFIGATMAKAALQREKLTPPEFDVPLIDVFKSKRLMPGDCLGHCPLLVTLDSRTAKAKKRTPYRVAQGSVTSKTKIYPCYRHCWLESKFVVVDLTRREKFFLRTEYYHQNKVDSDAVYRYTVKQMLKKMCLKKAPHPYSRRWTFWDLPREEVDKFWWGF